jgi:hypothetical protein
LSGCTSHESLDFTKSIERNVIGYQFQEVYFLCFRVFRVVLLAAIDPDEEMSQNATPLRPPLVSTTSHSPFLTAISMHDIGFALFLVSSDVHCGAFHTQPARRCDAHLRLSCVSRPIILHYIVVQILAAMRRADGPAKWAISLDTICTNELSCGGE